MPKVHPADEWDEEPVAAASSRKPHWFFFVLVSLLLLFSLGATFFTVLYQFLPNAVVDLTVLYPTYLYTGMLFPIIRLAGDGLLVLMSILSIIAGAVVSWGGMVHYIFAILMFLGWGALAAATVMDGMAAVPIIIGYANAGTYNIYEIIMLGCQALSVLLAIFVTIWLIKIGRNRRRFSDDPWGA